MFEIGIYLFELDESYSVVVVLYLQMYYNV